MTRTMTAARPVCAAYVFVVKHVTWPLKFVLMMPGVMAYLGVCLCFACVCQCMCVRVYVRLSVYVFPCWACLSAYACVCFVYV